MTNALALTFNVPSAQGSIIKLESASKGVEVNSPFYDDDDGARFEYKILFNNVEVALTTGTRPINDNLVRAIVPFKKLEEYLHQVVAIKCILTVRLNQEHSDPINFAITD